MSAGLGVTAAVAAGASFAGAGVLQQRIAARVPAERSLSLRLVTTLARHPMWLAGIGLAAASYALQALALSAAPLALVQPLLTTELVFAIPVSARLYGRRLGGREWAGILAVSAGLAAAVWGAAPADHGGAGQPVRWVVAGGTLVALAVALTLAGRRAGRLARASLYAAAAALVFALSSALLASSVRAFSTHGIFGLLSPAPYLMAAASLGGMLLVQSAFQFGPLAVTMPMLDWVEPLAAVVLAVSVLGESISTDPAHLASLSAGAVVALLGIIALDTSRTVRSLLQPAQLAPDALTPTAATACAGRAARLGHGLTAAEFPPADELSAALTTASARATVVDLTAWERELEQR